MRGWLLLPPQFGTSFLNKFEGSQLPNKVLENINLIDTPGILSGQKQREDRGYDFKQVAGWFAERCDLILLLFDAHKLDISDEFRNVIEGLKGAFANTVPISALSPSLLK